MPSEHETGRLQRRLARGEFALTIELGPPRGPDANALRRKAALLRGLADAYNVTDNQTAVVRLSSIAASRILLEEGLEPVVQMTCRDRNRIAIQSDLIGAAALGLRNCLCLSGDHQQAGTSGKLRGHPGAKNVYDVDSIQLLAILKGLRDEARQAGGDTITPAPSFFIGAAWTPLSPPESFRLIRLAKKIEAGADFIQTQAVFDVSQFERVMTRAREAGLADRVAILPGIIVPRSARMLEYMQAHVAGVCVPSPLVQRMRSARDPQAEGVAITIELVQALRSVPGISGIHLQAIGSEELLPDIIARSGLSRKTSPAS